MQSKKNNLRTLSLVGEFQMTKSLVLSLIFSGSEFLRHMLKNGIIIKMIHFNILIVKIIHFSEVCKNHHFF
jgi:hypothetical protein